MPIHFNNGKVYWQAHRGGGGHERPDNTLTAVEYGWALGGIPEIDLRLTADHELVCLHDDTLARTTDAPPAIANVPVGTLSLAEIQRHDAVAHFHATFKGQKVPALRDILATMRGRPGRLIYADLKYDDPAQFPVLLAAFTRLAAEFEVAPHIIACSCDYALNCRLKERVPGLNVMQWIGYWGDGNPAAEKMMIFNRLAEKRFAKLDQVQLHLDYTAQDRWLLAVRSHPEAVDNSGTGGHRAGTASPSKSFPGTLTNRRSTPCWSSASATLPPTSPRGSRKPWPPGPAEADFPSSGPAKNFPRP